MVIAGCRYNTRVDPKIERQLVEINAQFYQTFSDQFSATRQRIQPGVRRAVQAVKPDCRLLDIGCGNGNLFPALLEQGYCGEYTGIDLSPALVGLARESISGWLEQSSTLPKPVFLAADLTQPDWGLLGEYAFWDYITAFAFMHHIPGQETRLELIKTLRQLLKPNGSLLVSAWQFNHSEKMRSRVVDWTRIQMDPGELEKGDYLLDWRSGGTGFRYVHLFDEEELRGLATHAGFKVTDCFYSDGKEGNLGLYQTWLVQN